MRYYYLVLIIVTFSTCSVSENNSIGVSEMNRGSFVKSNIDLQHDNWKLVWSDEFNYKGLPDSSKWGYAVGGHGWGNNEKQYYTEKDRSNANVANGILTIIAKKQQKENRDYTSARLLTKGKFDFKYGRVETRAKVPAAIGTWPAVWMLGADIDKTGWPGCGEIDILEHRGMELNKMYGTLHYPGHSGGNGNGKTMVIENASNSFHKYALEWNAAEINLFIDNKLYHTVANSDSIPFNHNFFILVNLAMGGNFGGEIDKQFTKATLEIDYIRVYQK